MSRFAELVLVTPAGTMLGCLPAIPVATPWWNHAESLVDAARAQFGIDITILRLLSGEDDAAGDSHVTYLAETASAPRDIRPWQGVLTDHPLRHSYAFPGGPAADLAWAYQCLAEKGYKKSGPAIQVRSWTLSSLWRIPVEGQPCG